MYPAGEIRGNFNLVPPTIAGVENNIPLNPQRFSLEQNYPNPFNPSTTINYQLARSGFISLKVYDLLGRNISTIYEGYKPAGTYHEVFDARNLASGIYFYRLTGDNFSQVKKMLLLK